MAASEPVIRRATFDELPEMARCATLAFHDETLFGQVIHINRAKYPEDVNLYWLRRFQKDYWDWSQVFLVALDKDDTGKEYIAGFAQWHRKGKGAIKYGWGLSSWDPRRLLVPLASAQVRVGAYLYPNRAADPTKEDILERGYPYISNLWTGSRAESWYLNSLAVHPSSHKRGIGRKLVAWGMERATEENVSASVIAAYGKDQFYQHCGFVTFVANASEGDGNPLSGVPGGNVWFRDVEKIDENNSQK